MLPVIAMNDTTAEEIVEIADDGLFSLSYAEIDAAEEALRHIIRLAESNE